MNVVSKDIVSILTDSDAGLGLTFGVNLFISKEPSSPDDVVTIFDTGGEPRQVNFEYERTTFSVRVRSTDYVTGAELCSDVINELNGYANEVLNGARYIGIWSAGDVFFIEYDENERAIFSTDFRCHRASA